MTATPSYDATADHVESFWHQQDNNHHDLARHLAEVHGEDEEKMLDLAFDVVADEIHGEHHHGVRR